MIRSLTEKERILWLAALYEGEGSCGFYTKRRSARAGSREVGVLQICIVQKDRWVLDQVVSVCGGVVGELKKNGTHTWQRSGTDANAFLQQVLPYLSPWRQAQALKAIYAWRDYTNA